MKEDTEVFELEFSKDLVKSAQKSGISKSSFKKSLQLFGSLQLASGASSLDKKNMEKLSRDIKKKAWEKTKKELGI